MVEVAKLSILKRTFSIATFCVLVAGGLAQAQTALISGNHPASVPQNWAAASDSQQLQLTAVLALRNTAQLTRLESDLQDRHSPSYHKWLSRNQFVAQFGPTSDQMAAAADWLTSQGFTVTSTDLPTRRVQFTGSVATIRQALGTSIVTDGTNYANTSDPAVPAGLAPTIQAILGLSGVSAPPAVQAKRTTKTEIAKAVSRVATRRDRERHRPQLCPERFLHLL